MGLGRVVGVLVVGMVVLAGCADDHPQGEPAPAPSTAPPLDTAADVTLQQYRADEVAHRIGIQVTNRTGAPIEIATARIVWPGLAPIEPTTIGYPVAPGVPVDLRVDYGAAVCSDPPQFEDALPTDPPTVEVTTTAGDTRRWPVVDERGVLARVHGLDCRRQALEHLVRVELGRSWTTNAEGDAVTGELILTRRNAEGPASLTGISGSVLINVDLAPGAATTLTGDTLAVPIVVTGAGRCEAHALADSKKTYDFQVTIAVDGADASISVSPDPADERTLFGPVEVTCGLR